MKKAKHIPLLIISAILLLLFFVVDTYNIVFIKPIWISTAYEDVESSWDCPSQGIKGVVLSKENGEICPYMQLSGEGVRGDCRILFLDFQTVGLIIDGEDVGIAFVKYRKRFGKVNKFIISDFSFYEEYAHYRETLAKKYVFYKSSSAES